MFHWINDFSFNKVQFINFSFYGSCIWYQVQAFFAYSCVPNIFTFNFSKSFILHCTFLYNLYLFFIRCETYIQMSRFFGFLVFCFFLVCLFAYGCLVVPAAFVEKAILPPLNYFYTFVKISWAYLCVSILRFSILFHWSLLVCSSFFQYHTFLVM